MKETIYIRNARLIDPMGGEDRSVSVLVRDGRIASIETEIPGGHSADETADRVIDATGWLLFPGFADPHVHFRDPGFTEKEDLMTGAAAAAHGGFTTVIMMGNTRPHPDTPGRIADVLARARKTGIRIHTCGNVTYEMAGRELTDFAALKEAGAVLLSDDGLPVLDEDLMEKACTEAAAVGLPISLHEEDPQFIGQAGIHDGAVAAQMGLRGASRESEISMVRRDIGLAERTGAVLTVQHISAKESMELIRQARARGVRIHAEATPHHFTLTEEAVLKHGSNARMNPPLREKEDRLAIIQGIADGTIDMIATDHAPHTREEKAVEFSKAPSGIIGLETALSLVHRELVQSGIMTWREAASRLTKAYEVYGLPGGRVTEGAEADLVLFAPGETWIPNDETLRSKARNTPFLGEKLPGVVKLTVCRGSIVHEDRKAEKEA